MVAHPANPHEVKSYRKGRIAKGTIFGHRKRVNVYMTDRLFDQILTEAIAHNWPISRMIVHLCEASIEGIE